MDGSHRRKAAQREGRLERALLLFFLLSLGGWLWEVLFVGASTGHLVNRGVLHGPWLPVYGVGGTIFLLLPPRMRGGGPRLFLVCALLGGGVEYLTAMILEAFFGAKWWDYGGWAGSIGGRVCLWSAAAFGLAGWVLVRYGEKPLQRLLARLPDRAKRRWCRILSLLFAADLAVSLLWPNTGPGISLPL